MSVSSKVFQVSFAFLFVALVSITSVEPAQAKCEKVCGESCVKGDSGGRKCETHCHKVCEGQFPRQSGSVGQLIEGIKNWFQKLLN